MKGDTTAKMHRASILVVLFGALLGMSGCTSSNGQLPPVFGAVFGLESAETSPYQLGQVPAPGVEPGDTVIGQSATSPGRCVYRRAGKSRRFIADCPEGYDV